MYCLYCYYFSVPPVIINIFPSHQVVAYAGLQFSLRCVITLDKCVTISVIVRIQWTKNGFYIPSGDNNIRESLIKVSHFQYEAILHFNPLNIDNSGNYSCNFDILSNISDYKYVKNTTASANTSIIVQGIYFIYIVSLM